MAWRAGCQALAVNRCEEPPNKFPSPQYEKAALRWLERYLAESSPRLQLFADATRVRLYTVPEAQPVHDQLKMQQAASAST